MIPVWLARLVSVAIPVPVVAIIAVLGWLQLDKASSVRRAVDRATAELVAGGEIAALQARLAQEAQLRRAAETAIGGYTRALAEIERREAVEQERREQEIADYERKLVEVGRSCLLDDADVDWLRR